MTGASYSQEAAIDKIGVARRCRARCLPIYDATASLTAQVVAADLRSVGDTLLAAAAEHDAGLLVMGAYSHSRLREMLLGGATRHILKGALARGNMADALSAFVVRSPRRGVVPQIQSIPQ
jgi:nucleotide-binding universal stress UspA family protein